MSTPQSAASPQVMILRECGERFKKKDLGFTTQYWHKDFRYRHLPQSLGKPEQSTEEWVEYLAEYLSVFTEGPETAMHSITEVPGKVFIHATSKAKTSIGVDWNSEYISIIHFVTDEDGLPKVKLLEEFKDSKHELNFMQALVAAKTNNSCSAIN